jgi:F-type H+-transporting ATPase subunit gamma
VLPVVPEKDASAPASEGNVDFIYEPSKQLLLERLVPLYVQIQLYRAALESIAAEFAARMTAMENATKNAGEMIAKLTLSYNRARQASITKELLEIIGGAEALKG